MNAVSGSILLVLLGVVGFAPRRWALLAMAAGVFFLTQGHSIDVAGLNMYPIRFLEAGAFARVVLRGELPSRLNRIDWTLLALYNYMALFLILRSGGPAGEDIAAAVDPTLCYLALRGLMHDLTDLRWLLVSLLAILVPFTVLVLLERHTGRSAFTLVGADAELYFREGVPRCQGSFRHAILLGSVAASFLSMYISIALAGSMRVPGWMGAGLCLALVVLSNSGGPLTSTMAVIVGWGLWVLRSRMQAVRCAGLGLLVCLLLFMKAPIWYLPFKASQVFGGGGYHRGLLMERAWEDLGKWWFSGMDVSETAAWFPYIHTTLGGADITNQFVWFALSGGVAAVLLAVALIVLAFSAVGRALINTRPATPRLREDELLLWGLGVTVSVHAVSWLGVSYFDQSWVVWLTDIAAVSAIAPAAGAAPVPVVRRRHANKKALRAVPRGCEADDGDAATVS